MKLNEMKQNEINILSYSDLSELILKEEFPLSTPIIFKKVCDLLCLGESDFENLIGDYYTSLSTDKRFVLLENCWDLRERKPVDLVLDDEVAIDLEEGVTEEEVIDEEENMEDQMDDECDDDLDDDDDDLTIMSDDEPEDDEEEL